MPDNSDDLHAGIGVEEQRVVPDGYRRFVVSDNKGELIMDTLIRSSSVRPGFISGLHQFREDESGLHIVYGRLSPHPFTAPEE